MIWLRRLTIAFGMLAAAGAGAYYWLIIESHMPFSGSYTIDIAELRMLADEKSGAKPMEIRVETVGAITFPKTVVVAGDEVANKKPAPDIYHRALQGLRLPAECCMAFEPCLRRFQKRRWDNFRGWEGRVFEVKSG